MIYLMWLTCEASRTGRSVETVHHLTQAKASKFNTKGL